MYAFTNRFNGSTLHRRIGMMNGQRSSRLACWRYLGWVAVMGFMVFACRHKYPANEFTTSRRPGFTFPLTNATRVLAAQLNEPDMPWFCLSALLEGGKLNDTLRFQNRVILANPAQYQYPNILCLWDNRLKLKVPDGQQVKVFINGQPALAQHLSALSFEEINDLLVYQKWDEMPGADDYKESYRIFVSTTHASPSVNYTRTKWKQFMLANAVSNNPLGNSATFSMNSLLEASFFNNKLAFVKCKKDNHLQLYDEYSSDIDLYVNGLSASPKVIEDIHVREVETIYTRERPFEQWTSGPNRRHRFALNIQTSPKRAKRDSSYYVFSPFYSGDF